MGGGGEGCEEELGGGWMWVCGWWLGMGGGCHHDWCLETAILIGVLLRAGSKVARCEERFSEKILSISSRLDTTEG